jgi:hypothetical protein
VFLPQGMFILQTELGEEGEHANKITRKPGLHGFTERLSARSQGVKVYVFNPNLYRGRSKKTYLFCKLKSQGGKNLTKICIPCKRS